MSGNGMETSRLPQALLALRVSVFLVMFVWTLDKFVNPEHAGAVYKRFYMIEGVGDIALMILGALELVLIVGFLAGIYKRWTYGIVFALHAVSTLSTWQLYLDPFKNLLFFAAWPMLAACFTLYILREQDTLLTVKLGGGSGGPDEA